MRHKRRSRCHDNVDRQCHKNHALASKTRAHPAEQERRRESHKLREHNCRRQVNNGKVECQAVIHRHLYRRVHAVDIKPVGDEKQEHHFQRLYFVKGGNQLAQAGTDGGESRGPVFRGRLFDHQHQWQGKRSPPECDGHECNTNGFVLVSKPEPLRSHKHHKMQNDQQAATQIAKRIAVGRDKIKLLVFGNIDHHRIIESVAAGETDTSQQIHDHRHRPGALLDKKKTAGHDDTQRRECKQKFLARAAAVRDRPQDRREGRDNQARYAVGESQPGCRQRSVAGRTPVLAKNDREKNSHHGGRIGRVRPIIKRPGYDWLAKQYLAINFHQVISLQVTARVPTQ